MFIQIKLDLIYGVLHVLNAQGQEATKPLAIDEEFTKRANRVRIDVNV